MGRGASSPAALWAGNVFRGDSYGASNNSTMLTAQQSAVLVGVVPPLEVPAKRWKRAFVAHRRAMPFLYALEKRSRKPPDSSLSLMCVWWKALSANDPSSPVFDNSLMYDMLPRGTRILVGPKLRRFYPRLHHATVEIRTAFLDQTVRTIVQQQQQQESSDTGKDLSVRLISLGAGYDVRSIKFREQGVVHEAHELDLPEVIDAKQAILQRLQRRRPTITPDKWPEFHPVDLNDVSKVKDILKEILTNDDPSSRTFTIFLFEAVLIYLNEDVPRTLLRICGDVLRDSTVGSEGDNSGALVFADRLERIPGGDADIGNRELANLGWKVVSWQPKPGLARHMGYAVPLQ